MPLEPQSESAPIGTPAGWEVAFLTDSTVWSRPVLTKTRGSHWRSLAIPSAERSRSSVAADGMKTNRNDRATAAASLVFASSSFCVLSVFGAFLAIARK
jgi:hypothetical protein